MFKKQLFILIIIQIYNSTCIIDTAYKTGQELWKFYTMLEQISLDNTRNYLEFVERIVNGYSEEIRDQMDKIYEQLRKIDGSIGPKLICKTIISMPSTILLLRTMDTLEIYIQNIDEFYEEFYQSFKNDSYRNYRRCLSGQFISDVEDKMTMIRKIMSDANEFLPGHKDLVSALTDYTIFSYEIICNSPRIMSDVLYQLFKMVIVAEMKVNFMVAFANVYRFTINDGWKFLNYVAKNQFATKFASHVTIFGFGLDLIESVYLRACDPEDGLWIRGESFFELERTFQSTIFRYHWVHCLHHSCNTVWFNRAARCSAAFYDIRSSCLADATECAYLKSIRACALKKGPRRFQYVNSTELGFLGSNSECPKDNGYIIEDGNHWNFTFATCACNCYENHNKISLSIMESLVTRNMIIIGLRFVRRDEILYIQPKQGRLIANGRILRYSGKWLPIPSHPSQIQTINREHRVFFLDDLRLPLGYVLTGVKFNKVKRQNIKGFAIEIFGAPFDYESGKINSGALFRISEKASDEDPGKPLPFEAISSVDTGLLTKPSSRETGYVSLERSSLEHDFGQSTLPLFDAVPIIPDSSSPLDGIGIFHKGIDGYAGFFSLRVYGIKYAKYFHDFQSLHISQGTVFFNQSDSQ